MVKFSMLTGAPRPRPDMQHILSDNLFAVENARNLLALEGIEVLVKNRELSSAAGELPPLLCEPELWVLSDDEVDTALLVLRNAGYFSADQVKGADWTCTRCGETNEGQFAACWQCQAPAPQASDA